MKLAATSACFRCGHWIISHEKAEGACVHSDGVGWTCFCDRFVSEDKEYQVETLGR